MNAARPIFWCLPGTTVGRIAVDALWEFYKTLEQLIDAPKTFQQPDPRIAKIQLETARARLARVLEAPGLEACQRSGRNLLHTLDSAVKDLGAAPSPMSLIFQYQAISQGATEFDHLLYDCLKKMHAYVPELGGIIKDDRLVGTAEDCLSADARSLALPAVLVDINAAGRALAFDLGTASGFHMARALEATVEQFGASTSESAEAIGKLDNRNLGALCNVLAQQFFGKFPWVQNRLSGKKERAGKVIGAVILVKDLFRNELTHARDFVMTQDEAARLFVLSIQCMEAILLEQRDREWSTAAPLPQSTP